MHQEDSSSSQLRDQLMRLAPQKEDLVARPFLGMGRERRARLIIDHLVLEDFKSYAGRQVIGSFHGNFTSIVGPNGSGKSNLIESMLFIFGFNASWMRLNKLSQLIHNSSTATGNSKAAVEVHFKKVQENHQGILEDVPNSQFWIRRTVNASSVSKYFIDGRESTQAEVKDRLRSEGIDLGNNRFLILQGEVEQISQMKQKSGDRDKPGLLQYLEQIIGSSQYIQKIEDCSRQYNQTEEQKHQKGQLMKLVENELKSMTKAKDEAVRYVKKQKKIYQIQNVYNQVLCSNAREQNKKLREQLAELEKMRDKIVAEERQRLRAQADRIQKIKRNKADMEELQKNLDKYQEQCDKMQVEDRQLTQEITYKSEDLVKFQRKTEDADKEMSRIILHCEEIRQKLPASKEISVARSKEVEAMRLELAKYDKPQLRQKIKESEVEISKNELQRKNLGGKLDSIKENLGKATAGKGEIEAKLNEYQKKIAEAIEVRQKIEQARNIAQKISNDSSKNLANLSSNYEQHRSQLQRIERQLREQMSQHQEQGQRGNMFRQVMQQGFPGVLGRLGDLGEVSREHDEIITTACSRLDNFVVTDFNTATLVLDFLKKKQLGRATCIILQKIGDHKQYMSRSFQNLPRAARLFDLIKCKTEEAKLAFYFALSDTLFCDDSDLGLEYSMKSDHQRRRVICRNKKGSGYIIYEMNGLMVGSVAKREGFTPKAATKSKQKPQEELRVTQNRKRELIQIIEELSKKIQKQENGLKTAKHDLEQMRRELLSVNDSIKDFQEECNDLKVMLAKSDNRGVAVGNMQREAEDLEKELSRLATAREALNTTLKMLQEEQKKGQAQSIINLREKYKEEKASLVKLEKQVQKEKAVLQNSLKRIEELKKSKSDYERKTESSKQQIDKFKAKQGDLERKVSEIIGKMTAYEQKLKECKKNESEFRKMMEEDDKEVRDSKAKVEKAKREVQAGHEMSKRKQEQVKHAQAELQKIRLAYRELLSSYSFLGELDDIQRMTLAGDKPTNDPPSPRNSSLLQTSMLNSSFEQSQPRIFQTDLINKLQPLQELSEDQLQHFSYFADKLSGMIANQSAQLRKMEGSNLDIILQYKAKYSHYRERLKQFEQVKERQQELKKMIDSLKEQRLGMFREGFGVINSKLKEVYQHLTRGGDAQLELIDALDPFSDGVNFSVRPPKKSWKEVNKLSGGEKTLSSLSLIFALHYYKPTPLYFMDEIDAALDFKNVSIVADYIKKRTKDAQFIIISLRNNMFDLANKLIGVYKTSDKTKVVNLEPAKLLRNQELKEKENTDRGNRPKLN